MLNQREGLKLYALERKIRDLAALPNCFIWGIFDSCREEFSQEAFDEAMDKIKRGGVTASEDKD